MVVTGQKAPGKGRRDGAPEGNTVLGRTSLNQSVHPKGEGGRGGAPLPYVLGAAPSANYEKGKDRKRVKGQGVHRTGTKGWLGGSHHAPNCLILYLVSATFFAIPILENKIEYVADKSGRGGETLSAWVALQGAWPGPGWAWSMRLTRSAQERSGAPEEGSGTWVEGAWGGRAS